MYERKNNNYQGGQGLDPRFKPGKDRAHDSNEPFVKERYHGHD